MLFLVMLLFHINCIVASDLDLEKPKNFVNDYANLISDDVEQTLNNNIKEYKVKSGMEICVLTLDSIPDGYSSFDFSVYIFKKWGIGEKSSNNGILILIYKNDRAYEIRTGYGAEIVLTDFDCSRMAREELVPNFKNGNYEMGIVALVSAIQKKVGTNSADIERFKAEKIKEQQEAHDKLVDGFITFFIVIGIVALLSWFIYLYVKRYKLEKSMLLKISEIVEKINKKLLSLNRCIWKKRS